MIFSLFSGFTAVLVSFFANPVLNILLDDGNVIGLAYDYIKIVRWAMPVIAVFYGIYGFIAGIGRTKTVMVASVMTNLLNVLFNYVLIYGKLGFPAMGMRGAAWGTLAAQSIGCIYFLATVLFDPVYKKYRRFSLKTINWVLIRDIGKSCIPITLQNLSNQVFFLVYESFVAGYGTIYLGIMHVLFILYWTGKMISGGFAEGASILVGNALGRKEKEEALRYSWSGVTIAVIIGAVIASVTFFFPETVIRIFNNDPALLEAGRYALRFLAVFFFIELFGFPFEIIFTHNGWGGFVLISDFTTNGVFLFLVSYLLINVVGVSISGAYLPFALYLVFHASVLAIGFFSKKWMVRKIDSLS
jgi:putative MATE family efflux protein